MSAHAELRAALAAVGFLTRVPLPGTFDADDVRRAGVYFPLVGAGIGALTGAVGRRMGGPAAVTMATVLTGALHLDALGDSADALGSAERERALEIMRDSRIGSFGTAAVCLDLLIKSRAVEAATPRQSTGAAALSRAVPVLLGAALPYARPGGTAQPIVEGGLTRAALAAALGLILSRDRDATLIAAAVTVCSGAFWRHKLGGVTGDTLGASIELTETLILAWGGR